MTTYFLVLIMFFSYIWGSGIYHETWPGKCCQYTGIRHILLEKAVDLARQTIHCLNILHIA